MVTQLERVFQKTHFKKTLMCLPIQKTLCGAELDIAQKDFKESPRNPFKLSVS